ncbi:hypothetical protein D3C87_1963910 [compost metagenome]
MPQVCGTVSNSAKRASDWPQLSCGVGAASGTAGSCTSTKISSHDSALSTASTPKPVRHPQCCTTQASGVPVNISPRLPTPMLTPE